MGAIAQGSRLETVHLSVQLDHLSPRNMLTPRNNLHVFCSLRVFFLHAFLQSMYVSSSYAPSTECVFISEEVDEKPDENIVGCRVQSTETREKVEGLASALLIR